MRGKYKSYEAACEAAGQGEMGVDQGKWVSPRYRVVRAPQIGDKVSYAFHGDYYPDGEIVHITKGTMRIIKTSTGRKYYRRKNSSQWKQTGGTWSLVFGHINRWNREF